MSEAVSGESVFGDFRFFYPRKARLFFYSFLAKLKDSPTPVIGEADTNLSGKGAVIAAPYNNYKERSSVGRRTLRPIRTNPEKARVTRAE